MAPVRAPTLEKPSPWHQFTRLLNKYVVPSLYPELFTQSLCRSFSLISCMGFIKGFLSSIKFCLCRFSSLFYFHRTPFSWACRSLRNPRRFSLLVHSLVCPITHLFLDGFQPNLVQHFPHVYSTCHTIFSYKRTLECCLWKIITLQVDFCHNLGPDKSFA